MWHSLDYCVIGFSVRLRSMMWLLYISIAIASTFHLHQTLTMAAHSSASLSNESKTSTSMPCPICLEEIDDDQHQTATTICGHLFCQPCLRRALQIQPYCPICRRSQRTDSNEEDQLDDNIPWNPQVVRAFYGEALDERGTRRVRLSTGEETNIFVDPKVKITIDPNVNLIINGKRIENPSACNQQ